MGSEVDARSGLQDSIGETSIVLGTPGSFRALLLFLARSLGACWSWGPWAACEVAGQPRSEDQPKQARFCSQALGARVPKNNLGLRSLSLPREQDQAVKEA